MKRIKKGFTLVELLVVIAIIAILAAIIAPNAFKAIEKSKVATAESDYRAVKTATLNYYADTGAWPTNISDLTTEPTAGVDGWNGAYLEKLPSKNPWGGTYEVTNKTLILTSVPQKAAEKIDEDIDNGAILTGNVTYVGTSLKIVLAQ